MIALRTEREIDILREANQIVGDTLAEIAEQVVPGMTTADLDREAEALIRKAGAVPAFLGYHGYPNATCISVDEVVVHGIPGKRRLREGQIVSIDLGVIHQGYYGDAAISVACGEVDPLRQRLMETTNLGLARGILAAQKGNCLRDIARAIQTTCEAEGFSVVRCFVGHGIGTEMHEDPQVPNFDTGHRGAKLRPGMVLAIEPMINIGTHEVRVLDDKWTAVTADGKPSAHFEHTIVVREDGPEILSRTPKRVWGEL